MSRKLLFVVNIDSFFMSHRLPIALSAIREGFDVHIVTSLTSGSEKMESLGLTVHALNLDRRSSGALSNARTFIQIFKVFKRVKPDIVHLVTIKPVILGGMAARLVGIPCIVAAISGLGFVFIKRGVMSRVRLLLVSWLYRLSLGHKNLTVIFQNNDDRSNLSTLANLPKDKTRIIRGSGVDLNYYSPSGIPDTPPVVVLAARLLADKGVREFVQAAKLLKSDGVVARFVLVGEPDPGNPATISDQELNDWVGEKSIEWWGRRDDIPDVFASSHIVVLPSYYGEGLPKVLIEAAACGRAVVTTDHPGCRDAIEPEVTGILVPVRDSLSLANAIKHLLDKPLLCEKMGYAGRKLAERSFDVRKVVAQHLCIYDELFLRSS